MIPRISSLPALAALLLSASAQSRVDRRNLEFGFEQRVRNEDWNNLFDYSGATDDQRNQVRFRTRVWAGIPLTSNIALFAGLDSETNKKAGVDLVADEVMLETLYVDVKRLFTPKLSLRIGRQDLFRGEGFVLSDGTPWDGSRSAYVNAADLTWRIGGSSVEFIGILDPGTDRMLPRFHNQHRMLTEWQDEAVGLYFTRPITDSAQLEAYYFYKTETHDSRPAAACQPDRRFHTWGGRASGSLHHGWSYAGEWAVQSGHQGNGAGIAAWGGYLNAKHTFESKGTPYLLAGYTALSGDDPSTRAVESWDPLFARAAKWGDLLLYTTVMEKGMAYLSNAKMAQVEAGLSPFKKLNLRATYYRLGAFHPVVNDVRFGRGTVRGNLMQLRGDFAVNRNWRAHVVYEGLTPGSFYAGHDRGYFLRFEVSFLFRTRFPLWPS